MSNANKTVAILGDRHGRQITPLAVEYPGANGRPTVDRFVERLVIGRDASCDIRLQNEGVSRHHLEIYPDGAQWWIKDLSSSNGTYLNGSKIQLSLLPSEASIEFFTGGPVVRASWKTNDGVPKGSIVYARPHREIPSTLQSPGEIARSHQQSGIEKESIAIEQTQLEHLAHTHRKRFVVGMTLMALLLTAALGVIFHQQRDEGDAKRLAREIFYQAKSLELELSRLKQELSKRPGAKMPAAVRETNQRLRKMQQHYANFTEEMKLIGSHRSKEDLLIFRVARVFGEYDLSIPDDFTQEVKRYIRKWQQNGRLEKTMLRINSGSRGHRVTRAMLERDLPPQFLYLAVQESNFQTDAIGPMTRFGIPKGMWQFIPETATEYGLTVGPERERRIFDPRDDRFDFHKSTEAAANYLRFLYTTEALGSGLLVMSAYNWGHDNLKRKLDRLPQNPAERNFWRLLQSQQIPDETYGYVLSIVAAAVIGEDPKHFGFSFENPLADL